MNELLLSSLGPLGNLFGLLTNPLGQKRKAATPTAPQQPVAANPLVTAITNKVANPTPRTDISSLLKTSRQSADPVGFANKQASLPGAAWAPGGFFNSGSNKPLTEGMSPEAIARSQGATAQNQWMYPELFGPQKSTPGQYLTPEQAYAKGIPNTMPAVDNQGIPYDQNPSNASPQAIARMQAKLASLLAANAR